MSKTIIVPAIEISSSRVFDADAESLTGRVLWLNRAEKTYSYDTYNPPAALRDYNFEEVSFGDLFFVRDRFSSRVNWPRPRFNGEIQASTGTPKSLYQMNKIVRAMRKLENATKRDISTDYPTQPVAEFFKRMAKAVGAEHFAIDALHWPLSLLPEGEDFVYGSLPQYTRRICTVANGLPLIQATWSTMVSNYDNLWSAE